MNTSGPYETIVRRGRINLLALTVVILGSEAVIFLTNVALGGGRFFWPFTTTVLLTAILLRAMYRGSWLARRIVILALSVLFFVFLAVAYRNPDIPAWARLGCGALAGVYGGLAIHLARSSPIREFMARSMLRQMAADRMFNKDGSRIFYGKKLDEWVAQASAATVADRLEAVKGLKSVLQDVQNAECERALLSLAVDSDESIRYDAVAAIRWSNLIHIERTLAIETMQKIRSMPLPDGADLILNFRDGAFEDPDTVHEYFDLNTDRETAVALKCDMFQYAGEILKRLGAAPSPFAKHVTPAEG
jgi:hypothetical protein